MCSLEQVRYVIICNLSSFHLSVWYSLERMRECFAHSTKSQECNLAIDLLHVHRQRIRCTMLILFDSLINFQYRQSVSMFFFYKMERSKSIDLKSLQVCEFPFLRSELYGGIQGMRTSLVDDPKLIVCVQWSFSWYFFWNYPRNHRRVCDPHTAYTSVQWINLHAQFELNHLKKKNFRILLPLGYLPAFYSIRLLLVLALRVCLFVFPRLDILPLLIKAKAPWRYFPFNVFFSFIYILFALLFPKDLHRTRFLHAALSL